MGYLTFFAFFIMFTNFLLIMRAFITFKTDKFVTKEKPLVSILVPAYNESIGICDSINSLLNQDYPNFEIVVIDDGSSDDTYQKVLNNFGEESKVRVFTKKKWWKGNGFKFWSRAS